MSGRSRAAVAASFRLRLPRYNTYFIRNFFKYNYTCLLIGLCETQTCYADGISPRRNLFIKNSSPKGVTDLRNLPHGARARALVGTIFILQLARARLVKRKIYAIFFSSKTYTNSRITKARARARKFNAIVRLVSP